MQCLRPRSSGASVAPGSGTLSATGASGVTVLGSGTGTLSLSGTLSDINAFVTGGAVSFTTAANATSNVVLGVTIYDGGNTGSGKRKSAEYMDRMFKNCVIAPAEVRNEGMAYFDEKDDLKTPEGLIKAIENFLRE